MKVEKWKPQAVEMTDIENIVTGRVPSLAFDDYLAIDAVNVSLLKELARSPGHLAYRRAHPLEPSAAMLFGAAVDYYLCDGADAFLSRFCIRPPGLDLRTKDGKAWKTDNGHKIEVPPEVIECANAIMGHPIAAEIITNDESQNTVVWVDDKTGVVCKARPDFVGSAFVTDLKTTTGDADPDTFARRCLDFKYHWQAAHYLNGLRQIGAERSGFRFIVAEQKPPHRVEVYELDPDSIALGHWEVMAALEAYAECQKADRWPLSTATVQQLRLPAWAWR